MDQEDFVMESNFTHKPFCGHAQNDKLNNNQNFYNNEKTIFFSDAMRLYDAGILQV